MDARKSLAYLLLLLGLCSALPAVNERRRRVIDFEFDEPVEAILVATNTRVYKKPINDSNFLIPPPPNFEHLFAPRRPTFGKFARSTK